MDALVNVDNGRDVAFDGEISGGAANYFEQVCLGNVRGKIDKRRDPGIVLNWYDSIVISFKIFKQISKVNQ